MRSGNYYEEGGAPVHTAASVRHRLRTDATAPTPAVPNWGYGLLYFDNPHAQK